MKNLPQTSDFSRELFDQNLLRVNSAVKVCGGDGHASPNISYHVSNSNASVGDFASLTHRHLQKFFAMASLYVLRRGQVT